MEPITDLGALKPIVAALRERSLVIELTPAGRGSQVERIDDLTGLLAPRPCLL
jgi:hypothetical protein